MPGFFASHASQLGRCQSKASKAGGKSRLSKPGLPVNPARQAPEQG